ncbi:MAG TPA: isoprenylcysteine carboxylmethyltransferase family protein [Anaerolineae bacterium]|nr:isoprenylcysteine carboxylmethyltransferase family protein [Anaerolineae bacterium]
MKIFTIIYFIGIFIEMAIRAPIRRAQRGDAKSEQRITTQEKTLLGLLFLAMFFIPIIYAFTNWLDFANYTLPAWAGWLGVAIFVLALFIFWRAHVDLGLNWSPSLEIREKHELITKGIYKLIRHPMYASQWLWVIAQPLLLQNWVAGFLNLLIFIPFYFLRVQAEEKMMLDSFGEEYKNYMQKTGGVIPKF